MFTFFSPCYQTLLLEQLQCDDSVQTLLETILDAFDFKDEADSLRNIKPESEQAAILEEMMKSVRESAEFIWSYAKYVQVGTSSRALSDIHSKDMDCRKADFEEYRRPS